MITTAAAVTAEDVAIELIATKSAIVCALDSLGFYIEQGVDDWADASPVPLALGDESVQERLLARQTVIHADLLRSLAAFLTAKADRMEAS